MMYKHTDGFTIKYNEPSYSSSSSVILSQQTSRFWIPFDVKLFETLTPKDYLEKYCRINHRRYILYKRIFDKHKDIDSELNIETLVDALSDAYINTIDIPLLMKVIGLLDLSSNAKITFAQFRGIAAFSERYFFNIFRRSDNIDSQLQKDILEILDFSSLEWKLVGVQISSSLREILRFI